MANFLQKITVLILCLPLFGAGPRITGFVGVVGGGAAGCGSQTQVLNYGSGTSNIDIYTESGSTVVKGQTWTTRVSGEDLYSISIRIEDNDLDGGESDTLTIRADDDADMSSEYLAEGTATVSQGETGWVEVTMDTPRWNMPANTTVYFAVQWDVEHSDKLSIYRDTTDPYTGGTYRYGNALNINSSTSGTDLDFRIKVCD